MGHILAHLPRFCEVHNQVLAEYRVVNHVRSRTHPVPELTTKDGWVEAPFWVWRRGDMVRSRLFARQVGREVLLSDGREEFARLPLSPTDGCVLCGRGAPRIAQKGIRLRARALTTTLFARLCLADLFVHGIGGAKYDEMTDRILTRFFGVPVPGFLTMTATLHASTRRAVPGGPRGRSPHSAVAPRSALESRSARGARLNPEVAGLIAEKKALVAAMQSADEPC